jgi:hypothetical protein
MRSEVFNDAHGLPEQRLVNLLCLAYGSDPQSFAVVVENRLLSHERAEACGDEYAQVEHAFTTLISPHLDPALQQTVRQLNWLRRIKY